MNKKSFKIGFVVLAGLAALAACRHPEPQPEPDYGAIKQHARQADRALDQQSNAPQQ